MTRLCFLTRPFQLMQRHQNQQQKQQQEEEGEERKRERKMRRRRKEGEEVQTKKEGQEEVSLFLDGRNNFDRLKRTYGIYTDL